MKCFFRVFPINENSSTEFKIYLADLTRSELEKLQQEIKLMIPSTSVNFTYYHDSISSESIAKYLQDLGRKVSKSKPSVQVNSEINLTFPHADDEDLTTLYDISEYFGQVILGFGIDDLQPAPNSVSLGKGFSMLIKGFFSPMKSAEIIKILQSKLSENEELPWLAISFYGLENNSKFIILKQNGKIHIL